MMLFQPDKKNPLDKTEKKIPLILFAFAGEEQK